ncbi:MAG: hypothetical protein ACRD63_00380 [Pyrinomonadaceae bacterium]
MMTKLLEKAFAEASKLPRETQDMLATMLLDNLTDEKMWNDTFAKSQDKLAMLAEEALGEFQSGGTKRLEESL